MKTIHEENLKPKTLIKLVGEKIIIIKVTKTLSLLQSLNVTDFHSIPYRKLHHAHITSVLHITILISKH